MADLYNIEISKRGDRIEMIADWENHRHQAIKLKSLNPYDVMQGLADLHRLLDEEVHEGNI